MEHGPVSISIRSMSAAVVFLALSLDRRSAAAATPAPARAGADVAAHRCWADVEQQKALGEQQWVAEQRAEALVTRLLMLTTAMACGPASAQQSVLVRNTLESVLLQRGVDGPPSASEIATIHAVYAKFAATAADTSPELLEAYTAFAGRHQAEKVDAGKDLGQERDQGSGQGGTKPEQDGADDSGGPIIEPPPPRPRINGLQIGGVSLLVAGVGGLAAGAYSAYAMTDAQSDLNAICTPGCGDAGDASRLVARGELHETLAPILLAAGSALTVTGAVLVGVGTKRRQRHAFAPAVGPRFAGVSWAVRF